MRHEDWLLLGVVALIVLAAALVALTWLTVEGVL